MTAGGGGRGLLRRTLPARSERKAEQQSAQGAPARTFISPPKPGIRVTIQPARAARTQYHAIVADSAQSAPLSRRRPAPHICERIASPHPRNPMFDAHWISCSTSTPNALRRSAPHRAARRCGAARRLFAGGHRRGRPRRPGRGADRRLARPQRRARGLRLGRHRRAGRPGADQQPRGRRRARASS